jgi:hypothetical protein
MIIDVGAGDLEEIKKKLAYENWERRGRPFGSPEVDWQAAEKELASMFGERPESLPLSNIPLEPEEGAGH